MKTSRSFLRFALSLAAVLGLCASLEAASFTTTTSQGAGVNWTAAIWNPGPVAPAAGNTYELVSNGTLWGNSTGNTRVRNPATDGLQTFPGDLLTLNTNTDIRFKRGASTAAISLTISDFPGVGGNPGLILNGGILNAGDDSIFIVTGRVHVAAQSILTSGDNGGGAQKELRAIYLRGVLTGPGNLVILQSGQGSAQQIDADATGYSGNWIIQDGFLRGLTTNSLGSGGVFLTPTNLAPASVATNYSKFEPMYDWNTPGSIILSNNPVSGSVAQMVLHQNLRVGGLNINGTALGNGVYSYATLAASYPSNFAPGGSGSIAVGPPSPAVTLIAPPNNNATFYLPSDNLVLGITSGTPMDTSSIRVVLNGSDVSSSLAISGDSASATVTYSGLVANTIYSGTLTVTNDSGPSVFNFRFDTFSAADTLVIEAEDYNYGDGDCSVPANPLSPTQGGFYFDAPAPGTYFGLYGYSEIDYHDTVTNANSLANNGYRLCDPVGTRISGDVLHPPFVSGGFPDYEVWLMQPGEWMNYTRTIAAGNYSVYLRVASSAATSIRLDKVSGDVSFTTNQTTSPAGTFVIPNSGGGYRYVPLTDVLGSNAVVSFSSGGAETMRLTALTANNNVQPNYLLFVPVVATRLPALTSVEPTFGATNVYPDATISAAIVNGDTLVDTASIVLNVNGNDVTTGTTINVSGDTVLISYDPPGLLNTNTTYNVVLQFNDNAGVPNSFSNGWSFTTIPAILVLPGSYATAPGSGSDAGFNINVRKAPNAAPTTSFPNTILRAEQHLLDQIIDPATGTPFENEAAPGTASETGVINYEQSAGTVVGAGWFFSTNGYPDAAFPLVPIPGGTYASDPNNISLEATAYLELTAGVYKFGVRSDDNFKLTAGPVVGDTNLVLGAYDVAGGRADSPTEFEFLVESNGVYAFRLIYEEGQGGASLEFYSIDRGTGVRTLINDALVVTSLKAYRNRTGVPSAAPPLIVNVSPTNNTFYFSPAGGLSFEALAQDGNSIDPSGLHLSMNGTDVTGSLVVGGTAADRTASYGGLAANANYRAVITVSDAAGHTASQTINFDTFDTATAVVIEAEDYNYGDTGCPASATTGGLFIDNGLPGTYQFLVGLSGIDYSDTSSNLVNNSYRPCDYVGTQLTLDAPRPQFVALIDSQLWKMQPGEWVNYTRTFSDGTYLAYVRVSSSAAHQLRLSRVTSDRTVGNQTIFAQGSFRVPNTGGAIAYQYVPLTDASGNPSAISLSGVETLRLTSVDAADDVQVNFLILVPETTSYPPSIVSIAPSAGAVNVMVDAVLSIDVANGSTAVNAGSISLTVDGADVTPDSSIVSGANGASITYIPPTFFVTGSAHVVRLVLQDNGLPAATVSNQWTFTVAVGTAGTPLHVNFQASTTANPLPAPYNNYAVDIGLVYGDRGNGLTYGWDADNTANSRERANAASPNILYDTFTHLNKDAAVKRVWEIAIPNGAYNVHGAAGDPTATDSTFALTAEDVLFLSGVPTNPNYWVEGSNTVTVNDGRLTVTSQTLGGNNKINFLDITPLFNVIAPAISRNPTNAVADVGGTAIFAVSVRGSDPLSYQWLKNGAPLNDETNATLTINNVQAADEDNYSVTVTNSAGSATSGDASLTIQNVGPTDVSLAVVRGTNTIVISWPDTAIGWTLEETTNLSPVIVWAPTTNAVIITNGNHTVTVPSDDGNKFFHLKR